MFEIFDDCTRDFPFFRLLRYPYTGFIDAANKQQRARSEIEILVYQPKETEQIMLQIRKSAARGQANHGWLQSQHSFSFGDYRDPAHTASGLCW